MIRWHVYCRFFNDAATTDIYAYGHTLSRHDALPISAEIDLRYLGSRRVLVLVDGVRYVLGASASGVPGSTDLNSIPESARSEEHTSELQSLMRTSYAVFCLKKKTTTQKNKTNTSNSTKSHVE